MSQQHTPGPWMQSPGDPAVINGHREDSPLDDFVAMVLPDSDLGWGMTAERAANARLIAAAPDLLAALQDAEFLIRKAAINPKEAAAMVDSFLRSAEDARTAIAKAEGREG